MRFIRLVFSILLVQFVSSGSHAASPQPALRHVFDIHAACGPAMAVGEIPGGKRVMIPITGGTVEGDVHAEIIPGGADYQLIDTVSGRTVLDARYTLLTADGMHINVRNTGICAPDGKNVYFTTSPEFEAPVRSGYNWLNNGIFVCRPVGFDDGMVHLRVWLVE